MLKWITDVNALKYALSLSRLRGCLASKKHVARWLGRASSIWVLTHSAYHYTTRWQLHKISCHINIKYMSSSTISQVNKARTTFSCVCVYVRAQTPCKSWKTCQELREPVTSVVLPLTQRLQFKTQSKHYSKDKTRVQREYSQTWYTSEEAPIGHIARLRCSACMLFKRARKPRNSILQKLVTCMCWAGFRAGNTKAQATGAAIKLVRHRFEERGSVSCADTHIYTLMLSYYVSVL